MYQNFAIVSIAANSSKKVIRIVCTLDVDEASVLSDAVCLSDCVTGQRIAIDCKVNQDTIVIHLRDWPIANREYLVSIGTTIRSITGEQLAEDFRCKTIFKSEIRSKLTVTFPADYEEIDALRFAWKEWSPEQEEPINSYYLEIAADNGFFDLCKSTEVVGRSEIMLDDLPKGQYYFRIRAQNETAYGSWSKIVSFLFHPNDGTLLPDDPEEPVYAPPLQLISAPVNGETPATFLLEFDEMLSADDLQITLFRRGL